jgi:hypothetical protein
MGGEPRSESVMAYEAYRHRQLEDYEYPMEKVNEATLAPARKCRCDPSAEGAGDGLEEQWVSGYW